MRWTPFCIGVGFGLLAMASGSGASTFLVPADADLAAVAPVIAEVEVMSVSPSPAEGVPSTDYIVLVERLLKGRVGGTSIVVRVPGGMAAGGMRLDVHGAPSFREGERALLFLRGRRDGTYGIVHLALGAFYQLSVEIDGSPRTVALRRLLDGNAGGRLDAPRDWDLFLSWLGEAAKGRRTAAGYFVKADDESMAGLRAPTRAEEGMPLAWDRTSRPRRIRWRWPEGLRLDRKVLRRALDRWTTTLGSPVRLGSSSAPADGVTLLAPDGHNEVAFGDPDDLAAGSFDCGVGGLVALSATWYDPLVTFRFRDGGAGVARKTQEVEILVNDGTECLFEGPVGESLAVSTVAHELGHSLGLEHSSEPTSVMFPDLVGQIEPTSLGEAVAKRVQRLYSRQGSAERVP